MLSKQQIEHEIDSLKEDIEYCGIKTVLHNHYRYAQAVLKWKSFKTKNYLGLANKNCDIQGCNKQAKYFYPRFLDVPESGIGEMIETGTIDNTDITVVKWTGLKKYGIIAECPEHY